MGVTTYWSFDRYEGIIWKKAFKMIVNIILPYALCVFICYIVYYKEFGWNEYWGYFFKFNINGPHYFVMLYIQLAIVAPILFYLLKSFTSYFVVKTSDKRVEIISEIAMGGAIVAISHFTTLYTNINDIYGGGGRLLGGSYLICLYTGMLFGKYCVKLRECEEKNREIAVVVTLIGLAIMIWFICTATELFEADGFFGQGINPPGIFLIIYAFLIMTVTCLWDSLFSVKVHSSKIFEKFNNLLIRIGRNTLYIFLYHLFVVGLIIPYFREMSRWICLPVYYISMIAGPVFLGFVHKLCRKLIVSSFTYKKDSIDESFNHNTGLQ